MFSKGQKTLHLTKMNILAYICILKQQIMGNETSTIAPVTFTTGAIKELLKLKDQQEIGDDFGLRIGVEGGGCAGMNYILGFDQKNEGDSEFLIDGIRVFMNQAHGMYLAGMQIDFQSGLNARGFVFNNPNAESTCGCGTSFSA